MHVLDGCAQSHVCNMCGLVDIMDIRCYTSWSISGIYTYRGKCCKRCARMSISEWIEVVHGKG